MLVLISIILFIVSSGLLVWFLLANDRGPKEPKGAIFAAVGFGLLAVFAAAWAEFVFMRKDPSEPSAALVLLGLALLVGIIEEVAKFCPLALFIRNKSYFNEHTDGIIYFGIAGLTFGLVENIMYAVVYSRQPGGGQTTGLIRLAVLLFFHAATTGIVGYYYAKAKIQKQSIAKPIIALCIFACIHGVYDFLFFFAAASYNSSQGVVDDNQVVLITLALVSGLIISALLNTFLFLYYRRAQQWDASIGLAIDPKLSPQETFHIPTQGVLQRSDQVTAPTQPYQYQNPLQAPVATPAPPFIVPPSQRGA